jgi:cytochrome c peroxidase
VLRLDPQIAWRAGRSDHVDGSKIVEDGRLPNASLKEDHVRSVFYRMGFNDREIVALCGSDHHAQRCQLFFSLQNPTHQTTDVK